MHRQKMSCSSDTQNDLTDKLLQAEENYKTAKTEAIKEFVERVKQEINFPLAVWKVFDNLVKEMIGEQNE